MNVLKIIDSHIHPIPGVISPDEIIREMKKNSVEKGVILGMDLDHHTLDNPKWKKHFEQSLEYWLLDTNQIIEAMRYILKNGNTPNKLIHQAINTYPDSLIGFGSVQIGYQSKKYVTNKLKEIFEFGFKGIKILPTLQFYNPEKNKRLEDVFKFAEKNDLILTIHTGCDPGPWEFPALSKTGNPELLKPILKKFPSVKVILAHLGSYSAKSPAIWLKETVNVFQSLPDHQLYGDISAVPYLVENEEYINKLRIIGINKILFGSDYPVTRASLEECINPVKNSKYLTNDEKRLILYN
ncbi:MAG: amidohydrolase family protein, partial [Candidatus Thorarchaeota archaeon]